MHEDIKSWLSKTGYPLELAVQKLASAKGYLCEKSTIYTDIESGVAREVDLTAYSHGMQTDEYSYDIQYLFECKKSEKPLLVLCETNSKRERYEHYFGHEVVTDGGSYANSLAYFHLHDLTHDARIEKIGKFAEEVYSGYSIVPAFSKSDENIYKGIMGLAKANDHYRKEYYECFRMARSDPQSHMVDANPFQLLIPVLVVDAPLYTVYLTDSGSEAIGETDWASLLVRLPWVLGKPDEERRCNIQVVRKDALESFLDSVEQLHGYISQPKIVSTAVARITKQSNRTQKSFAFLRRLFRR